MTWPTKHFTADDLDAFHSEALSREMRLHLETCESCRQLVVADRQLLAQLSQLPRLSPRPDFAKRVLARVSIRDTGPVPVLSFPKVPRRAWAPAAAFAAALVLSVAWSVVNRSALDGWIGAGVALLTDTGLAVVRFLGQQPWYGRAMEIGASPVRLGLLLGLALLLSGAGLAALRRLVTPSAGAGHHATT